MAASRARVRGRQTVAIGRGWSYGGFGPHIRRSAGSAGASSVFTRLRDGESSRPARKHDTMTGMVREKFQALHDPRIEPALHVLRDFPGDVFAIAQPLQFVPRRSRPNRLFTLFAVITVSHADQIPGGRAGPRLRTPVLVNARSALAENKKPPRWRRLLVQPVLS